MVSYRAPVHSVATVETSGDGFVGRWRESAQLAACLDETLRGQASVALIEGEAGIGKTSLIKELQALAARQGVQVCYGRAYEDLTLPYLPLAESLLARLRHVPGADWSAIDALMGGAGTDARALPAEADHERLRAFLAVSRATLRMAQVRPVLLIVDDLHWADQASLDLFGHLVFAAADQTEREQAPLMIVGAYRPVEPDQRLARTLARLRRESICRSVPLSGLNERETEELIRSLGLHRSSHQLLLTIVAATGGNPLFIREVVEHLARSGALERQGDAFTSAVAASDLPVPAELREAIRARIDGLSQPCRWLLTRASLLGDSTSLRVLSAISGLDDERMLPLLEEGIAGRFVLDEGESVSFAHPLVRRVFASLPLAPYRRRMHRELAATLERLHGPDADTHLLEIAHHIVEAGEAAPATDRIRYARRAGDRALGMYAWSEAARFYDAAVLAAETGAHLPPGERADLHFSAGFAHYRDLDPDPAASLYERAMTGYREAGDLRGEARALIEHTLSVLAHGTSSGTMIDLSPLEDVLDRLGESDPRLSGQLLEQMSVAYFLGQREEQARETSARALAVGESAADDLLCAQAGVARGLAEWQRLYLNEALGIFEQALGAARRAGDPWYEGWPLCRMPHTLFGLGRLDEAEAIALDAAGLCRKTQDWAEHVVAVTAWEAAAAARGDFAVVERLARDAMMDVQRSRYPWGGTLALLPLALCRMLVGAWSEAEDAIDIWITPGQLFDDPGPFLQAGAWLYRQVIRAHAGDLLRVRAEIATHPQFVAGRSRPDLFSLAGLCALVEIGAELGDPAIVERPFTALQTAAERGVVFSSGWPFFLPRVIGLAAGLCGPAEVADRSFQEAIAVATRSGARSELARSCLDYARVLATRGDRADRRHAVELLRQAIPIFAELGMQPSTRRAMALAETLDAGIPTPQLPPPRFPDGLTLSEGRVLLEFARGQSGRQIADNLLISLETINRHAAGIEAKTGTTREGATSYAAANGLLVRESGDGAGAAAPRAVSPARSRTPLTVILFSDMKGSTLVAEQLGDARWMEVLRVYNAVARRHIAAQGGSEIKHTGDGIFAAFLSASGAIACAVAIQQAVSHYACEEGIVSLELRIGLNAGEPVADADDLFGASVILAQRICRRAPPGSIFVSEAVRELVRGKGFTFTGRGRVALKGFAERFRLYEVVSDAEDGRSAHHPIAST